MGGAARMIGQNNRSAGKISQQRESPDKPEREREFGGRNDSSGLISLFAFSIFVFHRLGHTTSSTVRICPYVSVFPPRGVVIKAANIFSVLNVIMCRHCCVTALRTVRTAAVRPRPRPESTQYGEFIHRTTQDIRAAFHS